MKVIQSKHHWEVMKTGWFPFQGLNSNQLSSATSFICWFYLKECCISDSQRKSHFYPPSAFLLLLCIPSRLSSVPAPFSCFLSRWGPGQCHLQVMVMTLVFEKFCPNQWEGTVKPVLGLNLIQGKVILPLRASMCSEKANADNC